MRFPALRLVTSLAVAASLVLGGAALASPTAAAVAEEPTMPTPADITVAAVAPTSLRVTWSAPADAVRWWVIVTAADDRSVGQRTACGGCRAMVVEHLAPASAYWVRVVAVDAGGMFGTFTAPVAATTPPVGGCAGVAVSSTCAFVDAARPVGGAPGTGLGSLHSITADTDPARVRAVEPGAWRLSALDFERFALARSFGGTTTALLSDPWMNGLASQAPWVHWELYEWWVGAVVQAHIDNGAVPDFWDVQNEPAPGAYVGGDPATTELVFEQYRRARAVIRSLLPDAEVIGPSVAYPRFGSGLADIDELARLAAATGTPLDGLSWHEIGGGCLGYCDGSPRAVLQHADDARAALAASGLGGVLLHVNEWGAPWNHRQPGSVVGYLSSLAYAGIDVANPTCWYADELGTDPEICFSRPGMLDGLLLSDGRTPTDTWFTHRAFAQMTGPTFRLAHSTIADPQASVVATVDPAGTVRVLLGRHTGCQVGVDDNCPGAAYAAPRPVSLRVRTGTADGVAYTVTVERIPSVAGALAGPSRVVRANVRVAQGRIQVPTYTAGDGEAFVVTMVPSNGGGTTTTTSTGRGSH